MGADPEIVEPDGLKCEIFYQGAVITVFFLAQYKAPIKVALFPGGAQIDIGLEFLSSYIRYLNRG